MEEHPVKQAIHSIQIENLPDNQESYTVGRNGVTRIEATYKAGLHANIPYVRVWKGDVAFAEFCQHQIVGVYFSVKATGSEAQDKKPVQAACPPDKLPC